MLNHNVGSSSSRISLRVSQINGHDFIIDLVHRTDKNECFALFRMGNEIFLLLSERLKELEYMKDSRGASIEEQLVMFLYIICHNVQHRIVTICFQHSTKDCTWTFQINVTCGCPFCKST